MNAFGNAQAGYVAGTMIKDIQFLDSAGDPDPAAQALFDNARWDGRNYYLYAATVDDPSGELSLLPADHYDGVPEYYMLHVVNPRSFGVRAPAGPTVEDIAGGQTEYVSFTLTIDGVTSETLTVAVTNTATISSLLGSASTPQTILYELAHKDINAQDSSAGLLTDRADAYDDQGRIVLTLRGAGEIRVDFADPSQAQRLGFTDGQDNLGPVDPLAHTRCG